MVTVAAFISGPQESSSVWLIFPYYFHLSGELKKKKKEQLIQKLYHPQNEKCVQWSHVSRADTSVAF